MRVAVLGAGLIGSAAARHLASAGVDVTLIGPSEPPDWATHTGVFGSHYDEGRITRGLDFMPFWAEVSRASIARYAEIEDASGISFFSEVGGLMAGPDMSAAAASDLTHESFDAPTAQERFSYILPDYVTVLCETALAGHVSPRRLVAAQKAAAQAAGARYLDETVMSAQGSRVMTEARNEAFDAVLWCAGGFGAPHLPQLPLDVQGRTIAFFEVAKDAAEELSKRPTLILVFDDGSDIYMLPPILYPNGKWYWKIGGGPHDRRYHTKDEMSAWFKSGGDPASARVLSGIFHTIVLDGAVVAESHAPCVTMYLPDDLPAIGQLEDQVFVATAGNGRGAKCSDELGRLGAMAVLGQTRAELDPLRFTPVS